jgi:phenylalanine-4-hydroxylase
MLTVPVFADFLADYAKKVLTFPQSDWPLLQRLFWFTVEFGLIETPEGLRAFGGGILSSMGETPYSLESKKPLRVLFDPVAVLRTPYRIDVFQAIYFVIPDFSVLYSLVHSDLTPLLDMAKEWKEYPPLFASEEGDPNVHIHAC